VTYASHGKDWPAMSSFIICASEGDAPSGQSKAMLGSVSSRAPESYGRAERVTDQPAGSRRRVFLWLCCMRRNVDGGPFNPTFLWYGRDYQRTKPSSPSLIEASLKVKRNNTHG